jgi:patatin-like phospholipase/acyl hydrolase
MPDAPAPYRILALSGGGYLGLYTAVILEALEARAGVPLARRFDLVAGTSIGGLLALALAFEVPLARMVTLFREHGAEVFSGRGLPVGPVSRLLDLSRAVAGPKYSGGALKRALTREFGAAVLGQAAHAVVVPAVDLGDCRTKVFKTPHVPASEGDGELRVVDVAMATCAAPAYFPAVRIRGRTFADGGLYAVAPDQVALHEAEHFAGQPLARIRMLSIGTALANYRPAREVPAEAGAIGWLADGRLALTLMSSQQQHVQAMMEDRLQERYVRLDAAWPVGAGLGLDVATPQAAAKLQSLAERTLERTSDEMLAPFLDVA